MHVLLLVRALRGARPAAGAQPGRVIDGVHHLHVGRGVVGRCGEGRAVAHLVRVRVS